jgi:hypothetical protein
LGRGSVRFENRDDGRREVCHPTSNKSNLIILELAKKGIGEYAKIEAEDTEEILTLDILIDAKTSSLNEIENVLVCWPICMVSFLEGARMSFVMALMSPQL